MNWNITAAIADITGAVGVILSLVYLGRQVSLSNRLAQTEAWRNPISDLNSLNASFAANPTFLDALYQVIDGAEPKDLNADQAKLVDLYLVSVCNISEQLFREVRDGVLDERALTEFTGMKVFELPFVRASWPSMGRRLGNPFAEYVGVTYNLGGAPLKEDGGPEPAAS